MTDAVVHLRIPAETKARWVRESRAAGMRLTDWIVLGVEMQHQVFDVTLLWHDGGSVFLGTESALSADQAGESALAKYIAKNKAQAKEIEEGGGFQLDMQLLLPSEAAAWLARQR